VEPGVQKEDVKSSCPRIRSTDFYHLHCQRLTAPLCKLGTKINFLVLVFLEVGYSCGEQMGQFTGQPQNPTGWNAGKFHYINYFVRPDRYATVVSVSCYHDMAHLQIADGGTVSRMENSYEYIEQAVADSR
jgi:hypothetical protein